MRQFYKISTLLALSIALFIGMMNPVQAVDQSEREIPIIVYGEKLNEAQQEEVRNLVGVTSSDTIKEHLVTGADYEKYIDGNPNSNMYSSVMIVREEPGKGLTVNIVTADNITKVTTEMYANALLTAGAEDATVEVASPVKVTGHSALTGIYKAYDAEGEEFDKDRMIVANEELDVATDLAEKEGMSQEKVSELLAEIKKAIADQDPATKEDVERIVKEQLDKLEISLSEEDRQMLINLFEKMRDLDIDFDQVKSQLEDITSKVKDKLDELDIEIDANFWEKVANFFRDLINAIGNLFGAAVNNV